MVKCYQTKLLTIQCKVNAYCVKPTVLLKCNNIIAIKEVAPTLGYKARATFKTRGMRYFFLSNGTFFLKPSKLWQFPWETGKMRERERKGGRQGEKGGRQTWDTGRERGLCAPWSKHFSTELRALLLLQPWAKLLKWPLHSTSDKWTLNLSVPARLCTTLLKV